MSRDSPEPNTPRYTKLLDVDAEEMTPRGPYRAGWRAHQLRIGPPFAQEDVVSNSELEEDHSPSSRHAARLGVAAFCRSTPLDAAG